MEGDFDQGRDGCCEAVDLATCRIRPLANPATARARTGPGRRRLRATLITRSDVLFIRLAGSDSRTITPSARWSSGVPCLACRMRRASLEGDLDQCRDGGCDSVEPGTTPGSADSKPRHGARPDRPRKEVGMSESVSGRQKCCFDICFIIVFGAQFSVCQNT